MSDGVWFKKPRDTRAKHQCPKPHMRNLIDDIEVGDRWQCNECGQVWEIVKFTNSFDRRTLINWKQVFAPGVYSDTRLPGESEQSHMEIR